MANESIDDGKKFLASMTDADKSKAFDIFKKLADKDNSDGQYFCGQCYFFGWGVSEDKQLAFQMFEKSAKQNNPFGIYELGRCYLGGEGVKKDIQKGWTLIQALDKKND